MKNQLPFTIDKSESFYERLGDWIGDVFYDILPEKGYELRDEQIFMAFQLEKAFKEKKVMFAEAGVGTGKTIAYLLYAICYARYTGRPAVIACADETLIEQLIKKEGDIRKIEDAIGLTVDVRLAKSRDQYLCLKKLDTEIVKNNNESISSIYDKLPSFIHSQESMQSFERYGDRKEYPSLNEEQWDLISWDSLQDCLACDLRHRCGQTLHREYYRKAADIIVCSQDFYMEHIWTQESRKREGQLPLLPEASCVIFDEGHLLEFASQKALTYKITSETLEELLTRLMGNDIRDETLYMIENILFLNEKFFDSLTKNTTSVRGSNRLEISQSDEIIKYASSLRNQIDKLSEQLVYEGELYVINEYDLRIVEEYLEQILYSLKLFLEDQQGISWFEKTNTERTLVIMPRLVEEILKEEVFTKKIPYIFSSATLSNNGDFSYITKGLGIEEYLSFRVDSPFDYEKNMEIHLNTYDESSINRKWDLVNSQIKNSGGRSLLLFSSKESMLHFKKMSNEKLLSFPVLYEGDREISSLVEEFQANEETVLCTFSLWEGLDIPGPALSNVIITELPFPPKDPVFDAKRKNSSNAYQEVDLPFMLLRLRQGIGRLIRTSIDKGTVHIWLTEQQQSELYKQIQSVLPVSPDK